jgi:hypothetical protein
VRRGVREAFATRIHSRCRRLLVHRRTVQYVKTEIAPVRRECGATFPKAVADGGRIDGTAFAAAPASDQLCETPVRRLRLTAAVSRADLVLQPHLVILVV